MNGMKQKYNLQDVATRAGVSLGTASKVINHVYVKPALRIRVEEAISELNYVPNEVARSLKSRRSKTIGVVIPNIASPVYGLLLRGVEQVSDEAGYSMIIYDTNMSNRTESKALALFKEKMVSGILYVSNTLTASVEQEIRDSGIPTALIMTSASGRGFSTVRVDNEAAARDMTAFLLAKGQKRILHLAGEEEDENAGAPRYRGYVRALKEAGMEYDPSLVIFGDYSAERGYRDMKSALEANLSFTAVFAASDEIAIGAMKAIREKELRIPEDISVAGFDGIALINYVHPVLCTVEQPFYQMGIEGTKVLIDTMELGKGESHIQLGYRIINEDSIADIGG